MAETSSRAQHDAALEAEVGDLTGVSPEVKEAREAAGAAGMRARELKEQTRGLSEEAVAQQNVVENFDVQKDGPDIDVVVDGPSGRTQDQHRRQVKQHKKSERALKETVGELEEKKEEYEESREEEKSRGEELRSREDEVKRAVDKLGTGKQKRVEERIEQLEVAEEAGEIETPPASGDGGAGGPSYGSRRSGSRRKR